MGLDQEIITDSPAIAEAFIPLLVKRMIKHTVLVDYKNVLCVGLYVLHFLVLLASSRPEQELPLHSSVALFVIPQKCIHGFVLQSWENHVKGHVNCWPGRTSWMLTASHSLDAHGFLWSGSHLYLSFTFCCPLWGWSIYIFFSRIKIKTYSKFSVSQTTQNPTFLSRLAQFMFILIGMSAFVVDQAKL